MRPRTSKALEEVLANTHPATALPDWVVVEMEAIPRHKVIHLNIDPGAVICKAVRLSETVKPFLDQIATCSHVDQSAAGKLEAYAEALRDLDIARRTVPASQSLIAELRKEGIYMANYLRRQIENLRDDGLYSAQVLNESRPRCFGYKDLATKLGLFVLVLKDNWANIEKSCSVTLEDLDRATGIVGALLRVVAMRSETKDRKKKASDARDRIFTLLARSYAQVRKAIGILRSDIGDADKIAPSLYAGRKRTRVKADKKPPELPQCVGRCVESAAPVAPAPAPSPRNPFFNQPFMSEQFPRR